VIIFFGTRHKFEEISLIDEPCPRCDYEPVEFGYIKDKFTLYFIPLFTISKKYALHCPKCGGQFVLNPDVGEQIHEDIAYEKSKRDEPY
jgi:hypothetical protein